MFAVNDTGLGINQHGNTDVSGSGCQFLSIALTGNAWIAAIKALINHHHSHLEVPKNLHSSNLPEPPNLFLQILLDDQLVSLGLQAMEK